MKKVAMCQYCSDPIYGFQRKVTVRRKRWLWWIAVSFHHGCLWHLVEEVFKVVDENHLEFE